VNDENRPTDEPVFDARIRTLGLDPHEKRQAILEAAQTFGCEVETLLSLMERHQRVLRQREEACYHLIIIDDVIAQPPSTALADATAAFSAWAEQEFKRGLSAQQVLLLTRPAVSSMPLLATEEPPRHGKRAQRSARQPWKRKRK